MGYSAELFEDSWQLAGMADAGMLPAVFSRRLGRFGTPWVAILFQVVLISFFVSFAFMKLRISKPDLPRPFRIPVRTRLGLFFFLLFPLGMGTAVFISTFVSGGVVLSIINVVTLLCGPLLYFSLKRCSNTRYMYRTAA